MSRQSHEFQLMKKTKNNSTASEGSRKQLGRTSGAEAPRSEGHVQSEGNRTEPSRGRSPSVQDHPETLEDASIAVLERTQCNVNFDDMFAEYEAEFNNAEAIETATEDLMDSETIEMRQPDFFVADDSFHSHNASAQGSESVRKRTNTASSVTTLRSELAHLSEILRHEFRSSIAELTAAQVAAVSAQSDVLRTLTEVIFQSSAGREVSPESLERAFSGVEDRLIARMEAAAGTVKTTEPPASATRPAEGVHVTAPKCVKPAPKPVSGHARSWSEIRSEMMVAGELVDSGAEMQPEQEAELPEVTQLSSDRHFRLPEQDPSLEIPAGVDPDALSDDELREAFREREDFITTLIARIRRQQETATQQLSTDQLRQLVVDLPDELSVKVRHTIKQMDDLARMGELELSLERARIARQISQLEHTRHTIEHNARQLGLQVNPDGTISAPTGQPGRGTSSRRWLGKLGFGQ